MVYTIHITECESGLTMKNSVLTLLAIALFSTVSAKSGAKDISVFSSASRIENGMKVEWSQSGTVELKMFNPRGQVVKSISRLSIVAGNSTNISMDDLSTGMYLVTINTGRSIQKISVVK